MIVLQAALVAGAVTLSLVGHRSPRPMPAWAGLDSHVSGNGIHRLGVLDARLELFLRESVLTVAPQPRVTLTDPFGGDGSSGCDSYTLDGSRYVTVAGISPAELADLRSQITQEWRRLGLSVYQDDTAGGTADYVELHGFGVAAPTGPNVAFS
jgi:hypothetical protein